MTLNLIQKLIKYHKSHVLPNKAFTGPLTFKLFKNSSREISSYRKIPRKKQINEIFPQDCCEQDMSKKSKKNCSLCSCISQHNTIAMQMKTSTYNKIYFVFSQRYSCRDLTFALLNVTKVKIRHLCPWNQRNRTWHSMKRKISVSWKKIWSI